MELTGQKPALRTRRARHDKIPEQHIIPGATIDNVISALTIYRVVAGTTIQKIIAMLIGGRFKRTRADPAIPSDEIPVFPSLDHVIATCP